MVYVCLHGRMVLCLADAERMIDMQVSPRDLASLCQDCVTFPATTARVWPDLADGSAWRSTVGGSEYAPASCK